MTDTTPTRCPATVPLGGVDYRCMHDDGHDGNHRYAYDGVTLTWAPGTALADLFERA